MLPSTAHTIQLVDGAVHVHLSCSDCSNVAWNHQQVAWLADAIAQRLAKAQTAAPTVPSVVGLSPVSRTIRSMSPPTSPDHGVQAGGSSPHRRLSNNMLISPITATTEPALAAVNLGKKGPRTRTGCFACRMKRVKCDEAKPICTRCKRNPDRHCVYPKGRSQAHVQAVTPRPLIAAGINSPMERARMERPTTAQRARSSGSSALLRAAWTGPPPDTPVVDAGSPPPLPDPLGLFLDGITYVSSPGLLNAHPTKPGARNRGDRVLAKLWEAQMFISASGNAPERLNTPQASLAYALVSATWSLGAVKRAFEGTKPTVVHDDMIARSRRFAEDAASVIHTYNRGEGFNDPETMLILLELMLLRDCGSGDPLWAKTHVLLTAYVKRNGGPRAMVEAGRAQFNSLLEHHLVYLATYDCFAALTLGVTPYFVRPGEPQWLDEVASAQQVVQSDFGMSLQTLFSVAALAQLLAERPHPASPHNPAYQQACRVMCEELETTALATIYSTPAPTRVQFGDLLHRHSLICHLKRVGFGCRADDPMVQRSAAAAMELLAEVAILCGSMINLNYPMLVVAGLVDKDERERLQRLIDFAKLSSGLVELHRMETIVHESWRRADAGEEELRMTDIWSPTSIMLIL